MRTITAIAMIKSKATTDPAIKAVGKVAAVDETGIVALAAEIDTDSLADVLETGTTGRDRPEGMFVLALIDSENVATVVVTGVDAVVAVVVAVVEVVEVVVGATRFAQTTQDGAIERYLCSTHVRSTMMGAEQFAVFSRQ